MNPSDLEKLTHGRDMDQASATEVVGWAWELFKKDLVLACSFSIDDMVLLDMLRRIGAKSKIVVVDSGRFFSKTYEFMDQVIDRYKIKPSFFLPDSSKLAAYLEDHGPNAFRHNHKLRLACCEIRRFDPLRRALEGHKAWLAGMRRSQGELRKEIHKVEMDAQGLVKICPLADWSWEQVWAYVKEHNVPTHPLYEQGYMSIGCESCTRSSSSGDERAGRWWWETMKVNH